ncbi:MAG: hypothetical protein JRC92_00710 [Deltaproteobacteria bacterium]|nr:hypothetical protein [Deltaproteobacteria bacterium]
MSARLGRRLIIWLGLVAGLGAAMGAWAFTVNTVGSSLLRWPADQGEIIVSVNLPFRDWTTGLEEAASVWKHSGSAAPQWSFEKYAGRLPLGQDGVSTLDLEAMDPDRLSRTQVWYQPSTGAVIEIDIRLNSEVAWQVDEADSLKRPDLISVLVQELGFGLGLGAGEGILNGWWEPSISGRAVGQEEIDGLSYLYPISGEPETGP